MNGIAAQPVLELRRQLPFWLLVVSFVIGVLSGLRAPNLWSATHLLFDYSSGFIKRGLAGEVLSWFLGHSVTYEASCVFSFGVFFIWVAMLFLRLNALAKIDSSYWVIAALFFVSPGFIFLVHEIGYLDHVGILVVLSCFLMPPNKAGLLARTAICSAMIFVHEAFFLMFFPVVVVEYWYSSAMSGNPHPERSILVMVAVVAMATFFAGQATLPFSQQAAYAEYVSSRAANFTVRYNAIEVLFRDGADNLAMMAEKWQDSRRWLNLVVAIPSMLPLTGGLTLISATVLRSTVSPGPARSLLFVAIVLAAFSPLTLNALGVDLWRFFALAQVSAFLILISVSGRARIALGSIFDIRFLASLFVVLTIISVSTKVPLFDGYKVATPPFEALLTHVIDAAQGKSPWIEIPAQ